MPKRVERNLILLQAAEQQLFTYGVNRLAEILHAETLANGWWHDKATNYAEPLDRNVGELLALVHSEVSEMLEGHRKDRMDDHLPHRKMIEVECADVIFRLLDMAGAFGWDIGGALLEKLYYNRSRHDHSKEARLLVGGKSF